MIQNKFDKLQEENQSRQDGVSSLINEADKTYEAGNFSEALEAYKKVFEATGIDDLDVAAGKMVQSGSNLAIAPFKETINGMTDELSTLQEERENYLLNLEAMDRELSLKDEDINKFNELLNSSEGDLSAINEKLASNEVELSDMTNQLEIEKNQVITLKSVLEDQTEEIATFDQRIEEMRLELESQRGQSTIDQKESQLIDREVAELTTLKAQLNRLNKSYTDFELMADNLEDNIQGDAATINALYEFFEEDPVEDVMPGISEYLRSFSNVYITAGTEIGLYEAVSLLYDLNSQNSNQDKVRLLRSKKVEYQNNDAMLEMIDQIEKAYRRNE